MRKFRLKIGYFRFLKMGTAASMDFFQLKKLDSKKSKNFLYIRTA